MKTNVIELFNQKRPVIVSGPCSAESEEQLLTTARLLADTGKVDILRAGIWKPRTRPGSFEGVGVEALGWMKKAKEETGLPISAEVAKFSHVFDSLKHDVDVMWIGARTTVNPFSVQEIADALQGTDATVFIKNPINPDIQLWAGAVERLSRAGITKIGLIHRGFSQHQKVKYRNDPKWQLALEMKRQFPELPMICDPSHICGNRELLQSVSQKALDLNMDGLMIESHINPEVALSDKDQQITPEVLNKMLSELVVRSKSIEDANFREKIDVLRSRIDIVDEDILKLLGDRMQIAEEIGRVKNDEGITILQPNRWDDIIEKSLVKGGLHGLSEKFMRAYLKVIHQESIDHQNNVMNKANKELAD
ncbi:chorismate mutase [Marinigracilibium pacificum]|uniref:chorismate mutase n=1 Tax=Marinigracilibium pacificum TaxID=2729599 RepID=A0A848IU93_9BACT|nr:chorismate mutase [Marinigracilibium pacificum]NMM47296.1 bifunctional 3-deoxy-7-phosphoheptulonate synthase/chorismate mutase type II [Marinigracilibium pacificum]